MVSGLSGTGLVLQDNGGNNLPVAASGSFTFTTAIASGGAYSVTVLTQPSNPLQNCVVTSGSGTASADVTSVLVTCTTLTFTIGVTVQNLAGTGGGLVLQDNGGDNLSVNANGSLTFATPVIGDSAYAVTVLTQPSSPAQVCGVVNGSGTAIANVTSIVVNCAHGEWAWISGSSVLNQIGIYGTLGMPAATNIPGSRFFGSVSWTDASGNLWLFGGDGYDSVLADGDCDLNDLWKYNMATNQWTWVSGSNLQNQIGTYGTKGTPAASNVPGARDSAVSWTDTSGNLWLFGGEGDDSVGNYGQLNDLWKYSIASNQWTWVSGSNVAQPIGVYGTEGTPAATNVPGGRYSPVSWADASGNLWLFGGFGFDSVLADGQMDLNDLWKYNIASNQWTWISGANVAGQDGIYGTLGAPAASNVPGSRDSAVGWADTSGNLWLFGGYGFDATAGSAVFEDGLNDLWKYNIANNQWTWISGSNARKQNGTYGTLGTAAPSNIPGARYGAISWADASGNFWLFGGIGFDSTATVAQPLNDLWEFTIANNQWTWMSGSNLTGQTGTYGTQGTPAPGNVPGNRDFGVSWTDESGNFWLFGGETSTGAFNDLWMYTP
jgi:hypothetical protein